MTALEKLSGSDTVKKDDLKEEEEEEEIDPSIKAFRDMERSLKVAKDG